MKEVPLNIYGQMFRGEMWCGIRRVGSLGLSGVSGKRLRVGWCRWIGRLRQVAEPGCGACYSS
ncbi:hypothetical protein [Ellagibacter isourolithinifaciens]|uniref:hypothetical protein n=1 Tax=Ellagibacter isourolithinifaciens TaxID=2137581 RepID=UPI003A921531